MSLLSLCCVYMLCLFTFFPLEALGGPALALLFSVGSYPPLAYLMRHTWKASVARICKCWPKPAYPCFRQSCIQTQPCPFVCYLWLLLHNCRVEWWCQGPRALYRQGPQSPALYDPGLPEPADPLGTLVLQASLVLSITCEMNVLGGRECLALP